MTDKLDRRGNSVVIMGQQGDTRNYRVFNVDSEGNIAAKISDRSGAWKAAVIDIDRATEFSGDDVDRYSSLVDLGDDFKYATVFIPAIDSAAVTPYLQRDGQVATVPVASHFWNDADADTNVIQSTVAGTGGITITFFVGCCQYLRLYTGANQTADRTFYVKGHN